MSETKLSTKIRYGREKKPTFIVVDDGKGGQKIQKVRSSPRNTLVTISDGTTIWFGISRCNLADKFDKDLGVEIALGRAEASRAKYAHPSFMLLAADGLSGVCSVAEAETLVKYFEAAIFPGKKNEKKTSATVVDTTPLYPTRAAHS